MKTILSTIIFLCLALSIQAEDLSFAFEGSATKRERLNDLQDSTNPPQLELENWINSGAYTLEDLKGKIVVLDFWATWCGPCINSIPKNNAIAQKYKDDVIIIGICAKKGSARMKDMVKEHNIQYPTAIDKGDRTNDAYRANGYPDYYVIDRSGKLIVADCANSKVEDVIKKILAN